MSQVIAALKKWLLAGLLVVMPASVTILVLRWIVGVLDVIFDVLHARWSADALLGMHIPGLGVIACLLLLLLVGAIGSNYFGKHLVRYWDALLNRIPVVRGIYSGVKQVSDTLLARNGNDFRKEVLVQLPHAGAYTIAFQTGLPDAKTAATLAAQGQDDCLSLYVPTTPNPTGGYFILVPRKNCHELNMSVDQALKYIISMGVVAPHDLPVKMKARSLGPDSQA